MPTLTKCTFFDSGKTIRLISSVAVSSFSQQLKRVLTTLQILAPVLQPLALDAWIEQVYREYYAPVEPSNMVASHRLQALLLPEYVVLDAPFFGDGGVVEQVKHLSLSAIENWLATISTRDALSEDQTVILQQLHVGATQTRLYSPTQGGEAYLPVYSYDGGPLLQQVPLVQFDNSLWVAGPTAELLYPAIRLWLHDKMNSLDLKIHWSWWYEQEMAEGDQLRKVLAQLLEEGWQERN